MSRYRKIEVRTWSDKRFCELSPIPPCGQGLWFFLLTGPYTGPIPGLFSAGRAAMAEKLRWSQEDFDKAFEEVSDQGMVKADFDAMLVWLPNAILYNKPESPNVVRSWRVELDLLPECDLKTEAMAHARAMLETIGPSYVAAFDELLGKGLKKVSSKPLPKPKSKSSPKTMPNQEQEQEQEQDNKTTSEPSSDGDEKTGPKVEKRKKRRGTEEDHKAARWMFGQVLNVNATAKPPTWELWADEVRLMREIDGRTHKDICELFQWAKKDSFWAPNIQSPAKLRAKWDQLVEVRMRASAPRSDGAWWATDKTMADKGAEFGLTARSGESSLAFKARIQECIDNGGKPVVRAPGPSLVVREAGPKGIKPAGIGKLSALIGAPKEGP